MERETRLQRYLRKDYTQRVSFPVEIVGRDGAVRRYGFPESVGLYQRRLRAAPLRHADPLLIDAEVRHCRRRIEQLRRSYLESDAVGRMLLGCVGAAGRSTGPLRQRESADDVLGSPLAADVASFVARAFPGARVRIAPIVAMDLDTGPHDAQVLHVVAGDRAHLLYAWRLAPEAGQRPETSRRAAYRAVRARLAAAPSAPDVERLHLALETQDVGLLLAGTGAWDGPRLPVIALVSDGEALDPYEEALRAGFEGRPEQALAALEGALEREASATVGRVVLARAAATMALAAGLPERAAFAVQRGALAAPGDSWLHALGALVDAQRGDLPAAHARVCEALDGRRSLRALPGASVPARAARGGEGRALLVLLAVTLAVARGRPLELARALGQRGRLPRHGPVARAWRAAHRRVLTRTLLACAAILGAAACASLAAGVVPALLASGAAGASVGWTLTALRRDALRALHGAPGAPFALAGPEYLPRMGTSGN